MKQRSRIKRFGDGLIQLGTKRNLPLYLVIFSSIALNSLAALSLAKYFSTIENRRSVVKVENHSDRNFRSRIELVLGFNRQDILAYNLVYLLPILLTAIPSCLWIILLVEKLTAFGGERVIRSRRQEFGFEPKIVNEVDLRSDKIKQLDDNLAINIPTLNQVSEPYTLLANMSHELRSPLNAILGFAQIMEQELSNSQDSNENIAIIHRSGEHLLSIINDLVDLAKIETDRLTLEDNHVDFSAWLDHLEQNFKFQAYSQGWQFFLIRQHNLPQYIRIDDRRLYQILHNLVNYCLSQSSASKVSIWINSKPIVEPQPEYDGLDFAQRYQISFKIASAGFSASAKELATLFAPLVRVQQEQKYITGSSLNLPLSLKLAQLAEGNITVDADDSLETNTFQLQIKAASGVAVRAHQPSLKKVIGLESSQTEYRILVVDDSRVNRAIMSQLLESVGFQVEEAVNGKDAVDKWFSWQPHMIWMDLKMPVMNGYEATELIKSYSQTSYIPIVALSASSLEEEKLLLSAAGCDDFVGKPFSKSAIFDAIAQHLNIRYIYESESSTTDNFCLTADTLKIMPDEWLGQVERAATVLDKHLLTQLLQEIPPEHSNLKNALKQQIDSFEFDRILDLVKGNTH